MRLEERPADAVGEYEKARTVREGVYEPHDRELCDVYFCLAAAYIDLASKVEESEVLMKKQEALNYYKKARNVLQLQKSDVTAVDITEVDDLIDILTESIDALQVELNQPATYSSSSASALPVTTIGFDVPTSQSTSTKKRPAEETSSSSDVQILQVSIHIATFSICIKSLTLITNLLS